MCDCLGDLILDWQNWSISADKSEDGWQSDFKGWSKLIDKAIKCINKKEYGIEDLNRIEFCFNISEEGEELSDYIIENNPNNFSNLLFKIYNSKYLDVRWQVYNICGHGGEILKPILLDGIKDHDSYCRRRALISLIKFKPNNSKSIATGLLNDANSYIKKLAIDYALISNDKKFIESVKEKLKNLSGIEESGQTKVGE